MLASDKHVEVEQLEGALAYLAICYHEPYEITLEDARGRVGSLSIDALMRNDELLVRLDGRSAFRIGVEWGMRNMRQAFVIGEAE